MNSVAAILVRSSLTLATIAWATSAIAGADKSAHSLGVKPNTEKLQRMVATAFKVPSHINARK